MQPKLDILDPIACRIFIERQERQRTERERERKAVASPPPTAAAGRQPPKEARNTAIVAAYKSGKSAILLARRFGVSEGCICQIVRRADQAEARAKKAEGSAGRDR